MLEACQSQVITKIYSTSDRSREITARIDFCNRRGDFTRAAMIRLVFLPAAVGYWETFSITFDKTDHRIRNQQSYLSVGVSAEPCKLSC